MDRKRDIIKCIEKIAGRYSAYEVFTDWIRCSSLSISNSLNLIHNKVWQDREQAYLDTIHKYEKEEGMMFVKMSGMLVETLETEMTDVLGQIYMESGMGSKAAGQFFTPYNVSLATARMALADAKPDQNGIYRVYEPSCGGGGMVIAAAQVLKEKGVNYQRAMEVVAQDLDWKGVYMCYLQLSLLGIKATVVQGDTLAEPFTGRGYPPERVLYTPGKMGIVI